MTMASWVPPALVASFCIALHYACMRAASGKLPDTLGALVLEGVATIGIVVFYVVGPAGDAVRTTRAGLVFASISGLGISAASILLFMALRRGGPVASTGAVVLGGGVALSAAIAPFVFGEAFTVRRAIGVLLGIAAMVVLGTEGDGAVAQSSAPAEGPSTVSKGSDP